MSRVSKQGEEEEASSIEFEEFEEPKALQDPWSVELEEEKNL